jgi:hypothetical protein
MRRLLRPPTRAYRGLLGSALRAFPASSAVAGQLALLQNSTTTIHNGHYVVDLWY